MKIVPIKRFGELTTGFRNIRSRIDGETGTFDLATQKSLPPGSVKYDETNPALKRLHDTSSPIVEGSKLLRLEFSWLLAVAVDFDVDVDLFGGLWSGWSDAPRLPNSSAVYPLVEIVNSPWKAQLPEWRARDNPDIRHIRMVGALASYDLLGELASGEWLSNPHEQFPQ